MNLAMRVLIQSCDSLKFYAGGGRWDDSALNAEDFRGSVSALDYIRKNRLGRAQIVLKFEKDEFDVILPSRECKETQTA